MFRLGNVPQHIGFRRFLYIHISRVLYCSSIKKPDVIVPRHYAQSVVQSIPNSLNETNEWSNAKWLNTKYRQTAVFSALVVRHHAGNFPKKYPKESTASKVKRLFVSYWYIVIPVYIILDVGFASLFYVLLKSGFDLVGIMKLLDVNEQAIEKVEKKTKTPAGRLAIVFILLKITAPIRYALTLALSTLAIQFLSKRGYVRKQGVFGRCVTKYVAKKLRRKRNTK